MSHELIALALGANRVLTYAGYVLLAGTFTFWSLIWADGRRSPRLVVLSVVGTALLVFSTLARPGIPVILGGELLGDALSPLNGAVLLVRLAALSATAFFLVDLVQQPVVGGRRLFALGVVAVVASTLVVRTDADADGGRRNAVLLIASSGHILATAAWLGGLVALAVVLVPGGESPPELGRMTRRFAVLANASVTVLVVTGLIQSRVTAEGIGPLVSSGYGRLLLIKVVLVALMLVLGGLGRRYVGRELFRQRHYPAGMLGRSSGRRRIAVVMGAELTIALVILSVSSLLVVVPPG